MLECHSVLGPLLFLIYVNDVAQNMLSFCRLYADDNSIQYADKNVNNKECMLNYDLTILENWPEDWLLQFNPDKTKVLFLLGFFLKNGTQLYTTTVFSRLSIRICFLS